MAKLTFVFTGDEPVEVVIRAIEEAGRVTVGDVLYALNRQKSRIIERTARGVDVEGNPFKPYSENGPYYWYPGKNAKNRGAARARAYRLLGGDGAGLRKTKLGVKFASYGAFKRSLGRGGIVDLMGARAPHMMQAIVVRSGANEGQDTTNETPTDGGSIGIYGIEAERAEGHNVGAGHLPRREFFAFSSDDEDKVGADILRRVEIRLARRLQ